MSNYAILLFCVARVNYYEALHEALHRIMNREFSMNNYFRSRSNITMW
jgi:hypothetical protein